MSKMLGLIVTLLILFGIATPLAKGTCYTQGETNASRPPSCTWQGDELIRR